MHSRSRGNTWRRRGAAASSPSEIPVSRRIIGGIRRPGLTRVWYRSITSEPRNLTAPISMTCSTAELRPVASRSRHTTTGKSPASSPSCSAQWGATLLRGRRAGAGPGALGGAFRLTSRPPGRGCSQQDRRQLRQFGALTLGQRHMRCQRAFLELLDGEAEPVAAEVEVGMVDLVGVSREDQLGPLPRPADDRLDLVRREVLGLVADDGLAGAEAAADVGPRLDLEEALVLQPGDHVRDHLV